MTPTLTTILSAAIPLLQPLIEKAVLGVEHALGGGTGPTKLAAVESIVRAVCGALSTGGRIPGTLDEASILTLIETTVQMLKANGQLPADTVTGLVVPAVAVQPGQYRVVSGTLTLV